MKRRLAVLLVLLLSMTLMLTTNTEATQGVLTKSSIEKCGGTLWGYHNKTRRHYHKAIKHTKNYYALDWSHEYKKIGKCKYQLTTAKKKKSTASKKKKKTVVTSHSNSNKRSGGKTSSNKSYANYSTGSSSHKATVNRSVGENDVAKADSSNVDEESDVLNEKTDTTPEVSNFNDTDTTNQDTVDEDEGSNLLITLLLVVMGAIFGVFISTYLAKRKRNK